MPRNILTNALNKSQLLSSEMLAEFQLQDAHFRWRLWMRVNHGGHGLEWPYLVRALTSFEQALLVRAPLERGYITVFEIMEMIHLLAHFQLSHA